MSLAVRASRMKGTAKSLNLYPTPPWATRALINEVIVARGLGGSPPCEAGVWDPCCGKGHMVLPLCEAFGRVYASDVHDWGHGDRRDLDFCFATAEDCPFPVDWVFANPPFTLADRFAARGTGIARRGVAMLVRLQWLEGGARYETFFRPGAPLRPSLIVVFSERVSMIEEVWDPEASLATAYAWLVWDLVHPLSATAPAIPALHLPPVMEQRWSRPEDEALATRGEARRRREAKKVAAS